MSERVGCSIDRKTMQKIADYGSIDAASLAEAIMRAAQKGREERRLTSGGKRYEQQRREAQE